MSDLTEALAHYETHMKRYPDWKLMPETEAVLVAARRWAELEAEVEKGARVVVEMLCSYKNTWPHYGHYEGCSHPRSPKPRIILGEGATE